MDKYAGVQNPQLYQQLLEEPRGWRGGCSIFLSPLKAIWCR